MSVSRLRIHKVRNITSAELEPARINIVHGRNGSGKTSILEAIYILGSGRSFRATQLQPVIQHNSPECTVFGQVHQEGDIAVPVGVQRKRDGALESRVQGAPVKRSAELARRLPLLLINSDTFSLLEGSPKVRRQFLDWGVFHVEHSFHSSWVEVQRCLRQRNSILRRDRISADVLAPWDQQLAREATALDAQRRQYFDAFYPIFFETLTELIELDGLSLAYQRGWDKDRDLLDVLEEAYERDAQRGYTGSGPHRADLRFRRHGLAAADVLSRGQQKLVVCAMKLAQAILVERSTARKSVFLVDDLPAELDREHRRLMCRLLVRLNCQVFLTCVDAEELKDCWDNLPDDALRLFHVEHGTVRQQT